MNRRGELSSKYAPIVAIDFDTIFGAHCGVWDYLTKSKLDRTFNKEYRDLTYKLYNNDFNVYITSLHSLKEYEDMLWGRYLFYNDLVEYKDIKDLCLDCKGLYKYYIDEKHGMGIFNNVYSLAQFKELL